MVYLDLVILLNFLVDLLLLLAADRLAGYPHRFLRTAAAAAIGGLYGGACLLKGFAFLGGNLWRCVFLALISLTAFGCNRSALRRGVLFVLLSMALGGIALGIGNGGALALIGAAGGVCLLCAVGFRGKALSRKFVTVELRLDGRERVLTALQDTGNLLRDPVSGDPVLVVGSDVARELLGLSEKQLSSPVETAMEGRIPGLRLIPYRSVGQPGGMLLAARMDEVRIGGKESNCVVAFAPQRLGSDGYEALAGGV